MSANDDSTPAAKPCVEIHTDGGCEPNPGAGGYGAVLLHLKTQQRREPSGGFRLTTNNRMEIFAAIAGLGLLKQPCKVTLFSDSQYLVRAALRQSNLPVDEGYENKPEGAERRPDLQEGQFCRKCSIPVTKQTPRKKPKGDSYYEFYLLCPNPACNTSYTVESAKRAVAQPTSLF